MYWSDGTIQSSVADGESKPVSDLDNSCKEHDREYAISSNRYERYQADLKFYKNQIGKGFRPSLYSYLVLYGNQLVSGKTDNYLIEPDGSTFKYEPEEKTSLRRRNRNVDLIQSYDQPKPSFRIVADSKPKLDSIPEYSLKFKSNSVPSTDVYFRRYLADHYSRLRKIKNRNRIYIN